MNNDSNNFIGTGWKFPVDFTSEGQSVVMLSGEDDIRNSLDILFATQMGERVMRPDFGSELDSFVFAIMNKSTVTYLKAVISNAILFNEPRIILEDIEIEQPEEAPSRIDIRVSYTVSSTNNRYNYVYPFYAKEGTNLENY